MRNVKRGSLAVASAALVTLVAAACGTSSSTTGVKLSIPTSGPGLTSPTTGSGSKVSGGTVTFTEFSALPPNYIFPMYSPQVCSEANISQFMDLMFRPLYWYGNNYQPTIDYDYSLANPPTFSNGNKTVTIKMKPGWKWSNGEAVTSRDLVFWMNVLKASPATEWCGFVPGYFPDNVVSYSAPDASTFVLHLNKSYNPTWFTYNELSQLTPIPLAWDRTSLSQPAPTSDNGHLPDAAGKASAGAIYKFLDGQSKNLGSYTSSPLWKVVDGPFKLQSFNSSGAVTFVPNPAYSGAPKPSIAKFVELPFTSEAAIFNQMRSGGPSSITIGNLPAQYVPQIPTLEGEGYIDNKAAGYSFNYFPLNLHNPRVGPIFSQLYFRQALQHLVDQQGWINAFLHNTANPTYTSIPLAPPSPLVSAVSLGNPYPFSTSAAAALLKAHGWNVVPGGTTTCQNPSLCGAGIKKGEGISFTIDYLSATISTQDEMNDLQAQARKVGINISLTTHPFNTVISTAVACQPSQPTCKWEAENWGAGWIYGPAYLPTGEPLYNPGSAANAGSYSDPKMTQLIKQTIVGAAGQESQALTNYANYVSIQVPVVFGPTSVGTYGGNAATVVDSKLGGYAANALGLMNPEDWYFTK